MGRDGELEAPLRVSVGVPLELGAVCVGHAVPVGYARRSPVFLAWETKTKAA